MCIRDRVGGDGGWKFALVGWLAGVPARRFSHVAVVFFEGFSTGRGEPACIRFPAPCSWVLALHREFTLSLFGFPLFRWRAGWDWIGVACIGWDGIICPRERNAATVAICLPLDRSVTSTMGGGVATGTRRSKPRTATRKPMTERDEEWEL